MTASLLTDHFPLLVLHATLLSSFFAILWRDGARERRRLFGRIWVALVGGAVGLAWVLQAVSRR